MSANLNVALNNLIFQTVSGSRLYGIHGPDSDTDMMGVCIEPPSRVVGFNQFEQHVSKELNGTIYGLRKFCNLLLKGNPTINELLWAPAPYWYTNHPLMNELRGFRVLLVNHQMATAYLGYLRAQKERLIGERGQKDVNRPELVAKYGYDTKYAAHAVRLGLMGQELLKTAHLYLPLEGANADVLIGIRTGQYALADVVQMVENLETDLIKLREQSRQFVPDGKIEKWMLRAYRRWWAEHQDLEW
jgi:hypothetical protein